MKRLITGFFLLVATSGFPQKYITESGSISFFSSAPIEDISALNEKITSIFDSETGNLVFSVPIKDFEFDKKLMKEHFNEKYMETEEFPKAIFKGKIEDYSFKEGAQQVIAKGELTIHGITRTVEVPGTLETNVPSVVINSKFAVALEDYDVKIPSLLFSKIAEVVEVTVDLKYKPYEK